MQEKNWRICWESWPKMIRELRFMELGDIVCFGNIAQINPALNDIKGRYNPVRSDEYTPAMFHSMKPMKPFSNLEVEATSIFFFVALKLGPLKILVAPMDQGQSGIDRRCPILFSTSHGFDVTGCVLERLLGMFISFVGIWWNIDIYIYTDFKRLLALTIALL